jgi:hypothetical protein
MINWVSISSLPPKDTRASDPHSVGKVMIKCNLLFPKSKLTSLALPKILDRVSGIPDDGTPDFGTQTGERDFVPPPFHVVICLSYLALLPHFSLV